MAKKSYNESSIESLDPREFTRLKPNVYCGDTTYSTQLIIEYFSNIVDEYVIGNGSNFVVQFLVGFGLECYYFHNGN